MRYGYCCSLVARVKSLYLHWPYCEAICHYCDFNKFKAPPTRAGQRPSARVLELERAMIECAAAQFEAETQIHSVFWGGGTPSLARPSFIKELHSRLPLRADTEVTLEANPSSALASSLEDLRNAGINRISIGVQSFDNADLRGLGRMHSRANAIDTISAAVDVFGGANVSIDLMYGLPDQTLSAWDAVLEAALSFELGHMSLYELTIKPGTRFHKLLMAGKFHHEPLEDLYFHAERKLQECGYEHYEVSNFCKPRRQAQHNVHHWQGGEYIGVGPGAVGRYTLADDGSSCAGQIVLAEPHLKPQDWIASVDRGEKGVASFSPLGHEEFMLYNLGTALRMRCGVCLHHWRERYGPLLEEALAHRPQARVLLDSGYLQLVYEGQERGGAEERRQGEGRAGKREMEQKGNEGCLRGGSGSCVPPGQRRLVPTAKGMAVGDQVQAQLCDALLDMNHQAQQQRQIGR